MEQFETDSNYKQDNASTLKAHHFSKKMQGVQMIKTTKTGLEKTQ